MDIAVISFFVLAAKSYYISSFPTNMPSADSHLTVNECIFPDLADSSKPE